MTLIDMGLNPHQPSCKLKLDVASELTQRRSQGILTAKALEYEDIFAKVAFYEFTEKDLIELAPGRMSRWMPFTSFSSWKLKKRRKNQSLHPPRSSPV